jgi:uncharacterized protein YlxW (UPF0749 family)
VTQRSDVRPAGPADASMTLLNEVIKRPLDPGYVEVAARKAAGLDTGLRGLRVAWVLVVAALLGTLLTTAVVSLREPKDSVAQARALLVDRITRGRAQVASRRADNATMSERIAALQSAALASSDPELLASLNQYDAASGAVAVSGPGVRVTLDDAVGIRQNPDQADPLSRVMASDVQEVVNGLWAAGAEAVSVNGERLTSLSAVREAGLAIQVNLGPVLPPYSIEAIGDPATLRSRFDGTSASNRLQALGALYGIVSNVAAVDRLQLAGVGQATLLVATVHIPQVVSTDAPTATPSVVTPSTPAKKGKTP